MTYDAVPQMGIPIHHRGFDSVLSMIDGFIRTGQQTGRSHQIVTVNTDFLVQARRYGDVHAILRSADLALADGMPIVWASAALGQRLPGRVAGADLVPALAERAAQRRHRLMFFGGSAGVAAQAAGVLRDTHPALIIGTTTGTVSATGVTAPEVLDEIREFEPDLICVALGHPKQERWIRQYAAPLGIPAAIGVGGTFDFIAGESPRAAPWIQRSGFEWLYRLSRDPGRLTRRYMTDIAVYVPSIMTQIARTRILHRRGRSLQASRDRHPARMPDEVELVRADAGSVVVKLKWKGSLDHHTAAALTSLATRTRRQGRELRLIAPGVEAMRSLEKLRLDRLIPIVPPTKRLDLARGRGSDRQDDAFIAPRTTSG